MKPFFFFFFAKIVISQNLAFERFQDYVKSPKGCVLSIEFKQSFYDKISVSNGVFYKKGETYIYENQKEYIKYEKSDNNIFINYLVDSSSTCLLFKNYITKIL